MTSNQKFMSKKNYFGIGICVFIFIIFIIFIFSRGNKIKTTNTTNIPNLPLFPVFPVFPVNEKDAFLEYYKNSFSKDASKILTNYDIFSDNYNILLTSLEGEGNHSMGGIISGFSKIQLLKNEALDKEKEIVIIVDNNAKPTIEQCERILSYDTKDMDLEQLDGVSTEIADVKKNIVKYIEEYKILKQYFSSNEGDIESYYKNINEVYDTFIISYNKFYEEEIKPSTELLNLIEGKLPNIKGNPLYEQNSENMEKVIEVSKFIEEFRQNINNIKNPLQEQYDTAKNNYIKYKDIYKNISKYDEIFNNLNSYIEKLDIYNKVIIQKEESQKSNNGNMDKLNMFKSKIGDFENNFMKSYNIPYNQPSSSEISSNQFSNIPAL